MYSGKIAVPPGGGGIVEEVIYLSFLFHHITYHTNWKFNVQIIIEDLLRSNLFMESYKSFEF
jgi:hypothetical protein